MTKQEQILEALHLYLLTNVPSVPILRNPGLAEMIDSKAASLRDGDLELVEEYINGPIYEFTMTPRLVVAIEKGADVDAALNGAIDAVALALEGVGNLGGLVDAVRVGTPENDAIELFGSPDIKGTELPIEIDYWTDRRVG